VRRDSFEINDIQEHEAGLARRAIAMLDYIALKLATVSIRQGQVQNRCKADRPGARFAKNGWLGSEDMTMVQ
jgi:hypothetical protein